jgi:hypothetical protein
VDVVDVINDCDSKTYYAVVFGFILLIVSMAIVIDDLTVIFGMIAAFSESMLNFVFPGSFFLIGSHLAYKFQQDSDDFKRMKGVPEKASFWKRLVVRGFILLGLCYFSISNYFNWRKLTRI